MISDYDSIRILYYLYERVLEKENKVTLHRTLKYLLTYSSLKLEDISGFKADVDFFENKELLNYKWEIEELNRELGKMRDDAQCSEIIKMANHLIPVFKNRLKEIEKSIKKREPFIHEKTNLTFEKIILNQYKEKLKEIRKRKIALAWNKAKEYAKKLRFL